MSPETALVNLRDVPSPNPDLVTTAQAVVVYDATTAEAAVTVMDQIADHIKQIEDAIAPHIKRAHEVHRGLTQERKRQIEPLQQAVAAIKGKIAAWREQEAQAARERAMAEAQRVAEEARAERERMIAEARAAGMTKRDAEAEAKQAEQETILEARAAVATAAAPQVAGVKTRTRWVGEVVDVSGMLREILDGNLPQSIIEIKQAELNRVAAAWKNSREFRGVKFRAVEEVVR